MQDAPTDKDALFQSLLAAFKRLGLLDDLIVVGGWALTLYEGHFGADYPAGPARANAMEFLLVNPNKPRAPLNVPAALEEIGFHTQHDLAGTKYVNGDAELAFLAAKKGKAEEEAFQVRPLQLGAMTNRYLDFLQEHAMAMEYGGFKLSVPEPAAFVLHKFLINPRRSKSVQAADMESIAGLSAFLLGKDAERARLSALFAELPGSLKKTVLGAADKHAPDLLEIWKGA